MRGINEPARIVLALHDTVLPGFGGALLLDQAEPTPVHTPLKLTLSHALRRVRRAIDEVRALLRGLHTAPPAGSSLEQELSGLLEVTPDRRVRLRIFVQGKPRTLKPAVQEQLYRIVREAVVNALRHSNATRIEVEIQYLRNLLRVFVRDNGRGISPEAFQTESGSHGGLRGMRERADSIGARFSIWSGTSAGTEVRIAVPAKVAKRTMQAPSLGRE